MCGLAGSLQFGNLDPAVELDERLIHSIEGRGPDEIRSWRHTGIALCASRLATIDSSGSSQPIRSGRWVLVGNGSIYNWRNIRERERSFGFQFKTDGDLEVLIALFERKSALGLREVRGSFAFALYDTHEGTLHLGRDRWGERPLYWYQDAEHFSFCSSLRGLLEACRADCELDLNALAWWLSTGSVPPPSTLFKNHFQLRPGYLLSISSSGATQEVAFASEIEPYDGDEEFEQLLTQATLRCAETDQSIMLACSGGLDSSAIALEFHEAEIPFRMCTLFDAKYLEDPNLIRARIVAAELGVELVEVPYSIPEPDQIEGVLTERFDLPVSDPMALHNHALHLYVGNEGRVLVGGHGADEILSGYRRYCSLSKKLGSGVGSVAALLGVSISRDVDWRRVQEADVVMGMLGRDLNHQFNEKIFGREFPEHFTGEQIARSLEFNCFHQYLNFRVPDENGYLNGVEVRSPYFDVDLVNWGLNQPYQNLHDRMGGKAPLRHRILNSELHSLATLRKVGFDDQFDYIDYAARCKQTHRKIVSESIEVISDSYAVLPNVIRKTLDQQAPLLWWRMVTLGFWMRSITAQQDFTPHLALAEQEVCLGGY